MSQVRATRWTHSAMSPWFSLYGGGHADVNFFVRCLFSSFVSMINKIKLKYVAGDAGRSYFT